MTKKAKQLLILCVSFALILGWIWQYNSLNKYWKSTISEEYAKRVFDIGETVTFADDIFMPSGFCVQVTNFSTQDYSTYLTENNIFLTNSESSPPDKVALVDITLYNKYSETDNIDLLDFTLHGIDMYFSANWDLIAASNPILKGGTGIALRKGETYKFILVYDIRNEYLSRHTRNHFDQYDLYLLTTVYPTLQEIKVQ